VVVGGVVNVPGSVFGSVGNCVVIVEVHTNKGAEVDEVVSIPEEIEVEDAVVMLTIDEVDDVVVMVIIDEVDDVDDIVMLLVDEIDNVVDVGLQRSVWALST